MPIEGLPPVSSTNMLASVSTWSEKLVAPLGSSEMSANGMMELADRVKYILVVILLAVIVFATKHSHLLGRVTFSGAAPTPPVGSPAAGSIGCSLQKPEHVEPLLSINISSYEALRKEMGQEGSTLYITDETGKHSETLLGVLGKGGCKKAIQLASGRALILPNMDYDPIADIARRWERIVLEEVKMSKILNGLGLLSPLSEQVSVTLTESSEHAIPAFTSETFENLSLKGLFIIDTKNPRGSTWKQGEHSLFQSDEERLIEKNWDSVFNSVLTDIAKICSYNIPIVRDSINVAVVKKASDSAVCQHEVRYFGFDFSSKDGFLTIPDVENRSSNFSNKDCVAYRFLDKIVDEVLYHEFGYRYIQGNQKAGLTNLKDRLVQRYTKDVLAKMSP